MSNLLVSGHNHIGFYNLRPAVKEIECDKGKSEKTTATAKKSLFQPWFSSLFWAGEGGGAGGGRGEISSKFVLLGRLGTAPGQGRGERSRFTVGSGGERPILPKTGCLEAWLRLSAASGRRVGGAGKATQESKNSSGGPGSPSRTRMRSSSRGSSGACHGRWDASRLLHPHLPRPVKLQEICTPTYPGP